MSLLVFRSEAGELSYGENISDFLRVGLAGVNHTAETSESSILNKVVFDTSLGAELGYSLKLGPSLFLDLDGFYVSQVVDSRLSGDGFSKSRVERIGYGAQGRWYWANSLFAGLGFQRADRIFLNSTLSPTDIVSIPFNGISARIGVFSYLQKGFFDGSINVFYEFRYILPANYFSTSLSGIGHTVSFAMNIGEFSPWILQFSIIQERLKGTYDVYSLEQRLSLVKRFDL